MPQNPQIVFVKIQIHTNTHKNRENRENLRKWLNRMDQATGSPQELEVSANCANWSREMTGHFNKPVR